MFEFRAFVVAVASLSLSACSSSSEPTAGSDDDTLLEPPAPGHGVQFRMRTTLEPALETERCQFFQVPAGGLHVQRAVIRYSPGSHHVLLYGTPYTEIPSMDIHGKPRDTSGVIACPEGAPADWQVSGVLAAAQSPKAVNVIDLPDGVAVHLPAGQVVLVNGHYLNSSSSALDVDVRINVESVPSEGVRHEAGVLFFYNPFIFVPGGSSASARMACPITHDITLFNAQSHMHRRGIGYEAVLRDPAGNVLEQLYTDDRWEDVRVAEFDPPRVIGQGHSIDYRCDYQNAEMRDIFQGLTTKDEMCMFIGAYYPRDVNLERCGLPGYGQTYIGTGSATCTETLSCMAQTKSFQEQQKCIVRSCPGSAHEVTGFAGCATAAQGGACAAACTDPAAGTCATCLLRECDAELTACQAAQCD